MSAICVRWVLSHTVRSLCGVSSGCWTPASRVRICRGRPNITTSSWRTSLYCTATGDSEQTPAPNKNKKNHRDNDQFSSVGRKISHRKIHLISDTGESLGTMHRVEAIQIMDQRGLKLVLLSERQNPPVYQLMSGKQIHEEQLKLHEKQKVKAAPVQVKELTLSYGMAAHDLTTKLRQVQSWLDKKHHVKLTLRSGRRAPADKLDTALEQIVQQMGVMVGFVSSPRVIRDGQAASCVLRPPTEKELSQKGKTKAAASQPAKSDSDATVNNTDATEGSVQQ